MRVRGYRLNVRGRCGASLAAVADVARMDVDPAAHRREPEELQAPHVAVTGVIILRADSGFGGSRMLAREVAAKTLPSRSITLTPFAAVHEPLGSLRRAMAFVAATERITLPPQLLPQGARPPPRGARRSPIDEAAMLIAHQVQRRQGMPVPSVLLDDVTDLDEPSVDACARAMGLLDGVGAGVVARIDSMSQLPRSLARFSDGEEVTLGRLPRRELLQGHRCGVHGRRPRGTRVRAMGSARGRDAARSGRGRRRGHRAGGAPVVEATSLRAAQAGGRRGHRPPRRLLDPAARGGLSARGSSREVLVALAHLGGEASAGELFDVVKAVAPKIDLQAELVVLRRARWIRQERSGAFCLMTRAQRESILESSRNEQASQWRIAVAKVLERADGTLRRAEAAQHAARAGMGEWASRLAMAAARTAVQNGIEESASALAAFAGAQNPMSDDLDLGAPSTKTRRSWLAPPSTWTRSGRRMLSQPKQPQRSGRRFDVVIDLVPSKERRLDSISSPPPSQKGCKAVACWASAPASLPPEPDGPPLVPVDYHELARCRARSSRRRGGPSVARRLAALDGTAAAVAHAAVSSRPGACLR